MALAAPRSTLFPYTTLFRSGNLKAAIRLLISEDTFASPSEDGLQKLKEKHPPSSLGSLVIPAPDPSSSLFVSEDSIRRSEEHTSELQSLRHLVCRLLLEKKK